MLADSPSGRAPEATAVIMLPCRLTPVLAWQKRQAIPVEELCWAGCSIVLAVYALACEVLSTSLRDFGQGWLQHTARWFRSFLTELAAYDGICW